MRVTKTLPTIAALAGIVVMSLAITMTTSAQFALSIGIAPPLLPVFDQPACPAPGYLWTPGYWGWGGYDYTWVPGAWVLPPAIGLLWTPGFWGWGGGFFAWNAGYWGPNVGFYGGINYGCGYDGYGYNGGCWRGSDFCYNSAVNNVDTRMIHNVYSRPGTLRNDTRASYNGGRGGVSARPTREQTLAASERHRPATSVQRAQERRAVSTRQTQSAVRNGQPSAARVSGRGTYGGRDTQRASGGSDVRRSAPSSGSRYGSYAPRQSSRDMGAMSQRSPRTPDYSARLSGSANRGGTAPRQPSPSVRPGGMQTGQRSQPVYAQRSMPPSHYGAMSGHRSMPQQSAGRQGGSHAQYSGGSHASGGGGHRR